MAPRAIITCRSHGSTYVVGREGRALAAVVDGERVVMLRQLERRAERRHGGHALLPVRLWMTVDDDRWRPMMSGDGRRWLLPAVDDGG